MTVDADLAAECELWRDRPKPLSLWLRDDDAIAPSTQLDQWLALCTMQDIPLLLAIIPHAATQALRDVVLMHPLVTPAQHGYRHANHAPAHEKSQELGVHRPLDHVLGELENGRTRLLAHYGASLSPILVPPWNRIAMALLPQLPMIGLTALSVFSPSKLPDVPGLKRLDCDIDIIDWKGTRGGKPLENLKLELLLQLRQNRQMGKSHIGILTHHLVHDAQAWAFLHWLFAFTRRYSHIRWQRADDLLDESE